MPPRVLRQPHAALADLCDGFFDDLAWVDRCPRRVADEFPAPLQDLLVHREHMTTRLADFYGRPVTLRVLAEQESDTEYARKIILELPGERPVEFGIVRIGLTYIDDAVRGDVLARRAPLGDILIQHGVLRRISPRWYFEFPPGSPVAAALGNPPGPLIGRVGTIYCDEEPAIELLEVVYDAREPVHASGRGSGPR